MKLTLCAQCSPPPASAAHIDDGDARRPQEVPPGGTGARGGGVVAPSFGSDCETDCESGGGDKQR